MSTISKAAHLPSELEDLAPNSRVWIYTIDRAVEPEELTLMDQAIKAFVQSWTSHNRQLRGYGGIVFDRVIILAVDENAANASGCSIDKSVHFLTELGVKYGFDPFNRWIFGLFSDGKLLFYSRERLKEAHAQGLVKDETLCLDNMVDNLQDLREHWQKPFGRSWIKRVV